MQLPPGEVNADYYFSFLVAQVQAEYIFFGRQVLINLIGVWVDVVMDQIHALYAEPRLSLHLFTVVVYGSNIFMSL